MTTNLKLRIACDLDDTILDFIGAYTNRFGEADFTGFNPTITQNVETLKRDKDFWENLPLLERPDFEPAIYCTKRINSKVYTRNSLKKNGLFVKPIYQLYSQADNKARIIKGRCDVLIDDSPYNVKQCIEAGLPALLIERPHNAGSDLISVSRLNYNEILCKYVELVKTMDLDNIKITPLLDTLRLSDISDEEYFSASYSDYVSNSRLKLINPDEGGCPNDYFEGFAKHGAFSGALEFGSAIHELTLQPEEFELSAIDSKPTAKMGLMAEVLYKKYAENQQIPSNEDIIAASDKVNYYKDKMDDAKISNVIAKCQKYWQDRYELGNDFDKDQIYLDFKSKLKLNECLNNLKKNRKIQALLHPEGLVETPISLNEQTILLDCQVEMPGVKPFIIKLKAKLDNYTIDKEMNKITLNDLKTTGHKCSEFATNSWERFHYYRQAGMYSWLLKLAAEKFYDMEDPELEVNFLLVSTIPGYYTDVFNANEEQVQRGYDEFEKLLKMVAYYKIHEDERY